MKEILFPFSATTVIVLIVLVSVTNVDAQEIKKNNSDPVLVDPNSKTLNPSLFELDGESVQKPSIKPKSNDVPLIDPNSDVANPLLFPLDDDAPVNESDDAAKSNQTQKELLSQIPISTRAQFQKFVLPTIQSGADLEFLTAMESLISKQAPESLAALEVYCCASGFGSLHDRFTKVLVEGIEQGMPVNANKLDPVFAKYVTAALTGEIELELNSIAQHAIMQDPLVPPEDWQESDELFWEVHVWKNRFLNLNSLVQYSIGINQPLLRRALKQENQAEIDVLQAPQRLADKVQSKYQEMLEREAEVRLLELAKAENVLRTNDDFEQRLHAAFALEMHGGELENFFRNHQPGLLGRAMLNDQQALADATGQLASGREHGKDVIEKAVLLRVGAHWWLRGRYGMASLAHGLLKPEQAMRTPALMFGLFMPKDRPRAIGEFNENTGDLAPGYERRHYYTWAVERRDLFTNLSSTAKTNNETKVTGTSASHFW